MLPSNRHWKQRSLSWRASRAPRRGVRGRSELDPGGWRDTGAPRGSARTGSPAEPLVQRSYLLMPDFRDAVSPSPRAAPLLRAAPSAAGGNRDVSPQESEREARPSPSPEHLTTLQAKPRGLVEHTTTPTQPNTNSTAAMCPSPDGRGKESRLNARDGTAGSSPSPTPAPQAHTPSL